MTSVVDQIKELFALQQAGIISEEEFRAAKAQLLNLPSTTTTTTTPSPITTSSISSSGVVLPTASPSVFPPPPPPPPAASSSSGTSVQWFAESHNGIHDRVYDGIRTVLQNIAQAPQEERFRILRLQHGPLREKLFPTFPPMATIAELLASDVGQYLQQRVGFAVEEVAARAQPFQEPALVLRQIPGGGGSVWPPLTSRQQVALVEHLEAVLQEVEMYRRRDGEASRLAAQTRKEWQGLSFEVRREAWERAAACGELESHVEGLYLKDEAGDGLLSAVRHLEVLRTILDNILEHPTEQRYRRLPLSNKRVHEAVVAQKGALELLCAAAKFQIADGALHHAGPIDDIQAAKMALARVTERVLQCKKDQDEQARKEARLVFLNERNEEKRQKERMAQKSSSSAQRPTRSYHEDEDDEEEGDSCRAAEDAASQTAADVPPRQRVSIEEAFKILMGKQRD